MKLLRLSALALIGALLLAACNDSGGDQSSADARPGQDATAAADATSQQPPAVESAAATPTSWTGDAINFSFVTADGETRTADSYAGKPLVLNFWAAW